MAFINNSSILTTPITIIIHVDNPLLLRLVTMYSISQVQLNPSDEYTWYNYDDLEKIIYDHFQKSNSSSVAVCDFVDFIKSTYQLSLVLEVRFIDDLLLLSGVRC